MKTIALILESNREYGRELLKGIARFACERKDWQLKMIPQLGIGSRSMLAGCSGVIARVTDGEAMRRLLTLRLPVVDLFRQDETSCAIGVGCDNRQIAEMAAKYFLRRGFRRFAFCGYRGTRYSDERSAAFAETVGSAGFPCEEYPAIEKPTDIISHGDQTMRPRNIRRFATWVANLPPQTAVFCANDIRSYHVLRVCKDIGRDVPSDIAIMGVDNDIVLCPGVADQHRPQRIGHWIRRRAAAGYCHFRPVRPAQAPSRLSRKASHAARTQIYGRIPRKSALADQGPYFH